MPDYPVRYAELFGRLGQPCRFVDGALWVEYNRMAIPVGPAKGDYSISRESAIAILGGFPKCLLVRATTGFTECSEEDPAWYAVVARDHHEPEQLRPKTRSRIKKGLDNFSTKMIDASYIAEYGYDIYISAFTRYGNSKPSLSRDSFKRQARIMHEFGDIVQYWGVFYDNNLIAYSMNYLFEKTEVSYSTIKYDPAYLKLHSSYALIHSMNAYYLDQKGFEYANEGYKSILHETNVQTFLIHNFEFEKAYTELVIFYRPFLSGIINVTYPIRSLLSRMNDKMGSLFKLEEIRREIGHQ
jgi:hypothetical protein